jgi:predicted GNAT family acetyltransferase
MADENNLKVEHKPDESRYELFLNGERIGFTDYRLGDGRIVFTYIEVDPALQGQGLASHLTKAALDDSRDRGLQIGARCPFIVDYLEMHPEYLEPAAD